MAEVTAVCFDAFASDNWKVFFRTYRYKFLREGKQDPLPFKINAETGLISTRSALDREKTSSYQIIVLAHDRGDVPQEATRLLQVNFLRGLVFFSSH